jgi:hypothetical protein
MKVDLYTIKEVAEFCSITNECVQTRYKSLGIVPYKNEDEILFDLKQMVLIKNYDFNSMYKKIPEIVIHTIHTHIEWHVYPSKLNFLTN